MEQEQNFARETLNVHLFFLRIMKEHALFLEAGFTPRDQPFARQAEAFKQRFEQLLAQAMELAGRRVAPRVLHSGELVTKYTLGAERQTEWLTGIPIDQTITAKELGLEAAEPGQALPVSAAVLGQFDQTVLRLLDSFIAFKQSVLENVRACRMFTGNYPLLIEHILREATLYRDCLAGILAGRDPECQETRQAELFWDQIMMEHALFIRGMLDPAEAKLIAAADGFANDYVTLLARAREVNDQAVTRAEALATTKRLRDFKAAGAEGLQACTIQSILLPLLADHVLREANHFIRLLEE